MAGDQVVMFDTSIRKWDDTDCKDLRAKMKEQEGEQFSYDGKEYVFKFVNKKGLQLQEVETQKFIKGGLAGFKDSLGYVVRV